MKNMTGGMLLVLGALLAGPAWAQGTNDCVPSPTNMPNAAYPRVCSDYRVMFKLEAPEARKVQLQPSPGANPNGLGAGPFDMVRGPDGVWSLTLGPVRPGLHYYNFLVDGLAVNDPGSNTYTVSLGLQSTWGANRATSGFEVPEKGVDFFLPKDVPHGAVEELWYKAKTTNEYRRAFVYIPPGYDKSLTTRYPVLYLQHGGTNDETSWVREGHVGFIMDNLLAEKKIVPMLVVMERGTAIMSQTSARQTVPYNPELYKAFDPDNTLLGKVWTTDLVPTIDARYRTLADREHRAIAGLSNGSEHALKIGMAHLDMYASIGALSPGGASRDYFAAPTTYMSGMVTEGKGPFLNSRLKLLWIGTGTAEGSYKDISRLRQTMDTYGIKHVDYDVPGTAHEWATWRRHLYDFAPRLFR